MNAQQTDSPLSPERIVELRRYKAELAGELLSVTAQMRMIDALIEDSGSAS
jgi:hypothetical protein